jgi:hypothetical protein
MADDTESAVELLRDIRAKMEVLDAKLDALDARLRNLGDRLDDLHDAVVMAPSRTRAVSAPDSEKTGMDDISAQLDKILGNGKPK